MPILTSAELKPEQLYCDCAAGTFDFRTTAELPDLSQVIGQPRAVEAIRFGMGMRGPGYNMYALGPNGTGKTTTIRQFIEQEAAKGAAPDDWCYVHNFKNPDHPAALHMPAGQGTLLRKDMKQLLDELKAAIPAAFESEDYAARKQEIEAKLREQQEKALGGLRRRGELRGLTMIKTQEGIAFAPFASGQVMNPEQFQALPPQQRDQLEKDMAALEGELQDVVRELRQVEKATLEQLQQLNRQVASFAVGHRISELRDKYAAIPKVAAYLTAMQDDVIENVGDFSAERSAPPSFMGVPLPAGMAREPSFARYEINLIVDHASAKGAPIVVVDNPTFQNLVGVVEYSSEMGALVTDFTLIKPGALHLANGGFLMVEAATLLQKPFAWEGLKRALRSGQVSIEPLGREYSTVSTITLEPEPIPLAVKVVLVGEPMLYYLLQANDPDFQELFKVQVDFAEDMERNSENCQLYAQFIGTVARREELHPFASSAVARVIEHAARLTENQERLSIHFRAIVDLLREADYWALQRQADVVGAEDVQHAIDTGIYRADRVRERIHEEIAKGTILIDVRGAKVGQINGLSVSGMGSLSFGQPNRITARTRLGRGQVVDIEREVALGGPLHSKGVLILSGFLSANFCPEEPLSLAASLVFEQSYGGVDGDSASSAELYALLSALSGVPIRQSLAVTGSVNQNGEVQPIGGANEKIEGYFDVCRLMPGGLTGEQGVMIPRTNVRHLMLRHDVVEAVRQGQFHVYAVSTIADGIEVLTGVAAGERDAAGAFAEGTVYRRVEDKLRLFAARARAQGEGDKEHRS
jgi:lon-related putative ATP-dependent protease